MKFYFIVVLLIIIPILHYFADTYIVMIMSVQAVKPYLKQQANSTITNFKNKSDGFYSYISRKGISIKHVFKSTYRISHLHWNCEIDTSIAKHYIKKNISWKDMFETRIDVLSNRTIFSPDTLRHKMGILPDDGTPVVLVARQGNLNIPKDTVIIRLNDHGPPDARTTMRMVWPRRVTYLTGHARKRPNDELIRWYRRHKPGLVSFFNTSQPLVIPETVWNDANLKYYRGPLFFMKGGFGFFGHLAKCYPDDGVGLGALNRVVHLKGEISTLGFSTNIDQYNTAYYNRFKLLAHKLAWSYFVVKELTDTL